MAFEARWNGTVIAQADKTVLVEGNHYFPAASVDRTVLSETDKTTHCPWKGDARYYTIEAGGERNENAAWYYPQPKDKAAEIKNHVAFWNGVQVLEV